MRLSNRLQHLEREVTIGVARAHQAWLREQKVPAVGDRLGFVYASRSLESSRRESNIMSARETRARRAVRAPSAKGTY